MEIDHAIPESLKGADLSQALSEQSLPEDYDVQSTVNLVPACGRPCNRRKRAKRLPMTGAVSAVLEIAEERAPAIEADAERYRRVNAFREAIAIVNSAPATHYDALTDEERAALRRAATFVAYTVAPSDPTAVVVHRFINPHDYIPPETRDAGDLITPDDFLDLLQTWFSEESTEANDVIRSCWGDDYQRLRSAWPTSVDRLEYSAQADRFLARVTFSIEYTHYDRDRTGGPADTDDTLDLWVSVNDALDAVADAFVDLAGAFPD